MTLSLRARLLLGLVTLVVVGLLVSDVATYTALQSFLSQRVDQQLLDGKFGAIQALNGGPQGGGGGPPPGSSRGGPQHDMQFPPGTYLQLRSAGGTLLAEQAYGFGGSTSSARPVLPGRLPSLQTDVPVLHDYPGSGGVARFDVLLEALPPDGDTVLVFAIPLTEVQSTLDRLLLLEATVSGGVLAGLVLLAWWIVRIGLRPLERMGATAQAIAAGDLSRRVEPATSRSEIGRLGLALNGMLSQIEKAFDERTRSEQRLRRFLADASHELRTPLTSIRGYAEMLRRGTSLKPDDAEQARRRIEAEAVRMSVLVDDLLLLARLDQGRPLEQAPVDLQAIARDACADAAAVAPARRITLTAPEPIVVTGDDLRLRQVVGNLLRNAVVHTPPGTPIEVGVANGGGRAVLTVADHGPGLPPEEVGRVFEPFYRADAGRSRDRGGSGLGLSIVAAVVAAHGGQVRAQQTEGGGATFRVELPLALRS